MEGAGEEDLGGSAADFSGGGRAFATESEAEDADEGTGGEFGGEAGTIQDGGREKGGFERARFPLEAWAGDAEGAGVLAFE